MALPAGNSLVRRKSIVAIIPEHRWHEAQMKRDLVWKRIQVKSIDALIMPDTLHIGKAGQLAVMAELASRGYNVAIPEIDKGDDVFVVNNQSGAMWRIQVKTSNGRAQRNSRAYQFRTLQTSISNPQTPELHFAFVLRADDRWRFVVMDRAVLNNYVIGQRLGTAAGQYRQISITLHNNGDVICSGINLNHHRENWNTWPVL
jgi:hypothetical protein